MTTGKRQTAREKAKAAGRKKAKALEVKKDREYVKRINAQVRATKGRVYVENPEEVVRMLGLEMWEFEVLTGDEAFNADIEIFMDFQGKEMRIYIEDGVLSVYTD